jgi:hypothetical protein
MKPVKIVLLAVPLAAACSQEPDVPQFRSYDLELVPMARYSTYIGVAPKSVGADLPRFREMDSKAFSEYLRDSIGCVYDDSREIMPLGRKRTPAGYIVPVSCL